jgi:hypothetical protein
MSNIRVSFRTQENMFLRSLRVAILCCSWNLVNQHKNRISRYITLFSHLIWCMAPYFITPDNRMCRTLFNGTERNIHIDTCAGFKYGMASVLRKYDGGVGPGF